MRMLLERQEGVVQLAHKKNQSWLCFMPSISRQNSFSQSKPRRQQQMPMEGSMLLILQMRKEPQKQLSWMEETSILAYWTQWGSRQMRESPLQVPRKQRALPGRPPITPFELLSFIISISTFKYFYSGYSSPILVSRTTPIDLLAALHFAHITCRCLALHSHLTSSLPPSITSTIWSKKRFPLLKTKKDSLSELSSWLWLSVERIWEIWEGLYQSPGRMPYYFLATLLMFWMEKGRDLSKSLNISMISVISCWVLTPLCSLMISAKAIWPTRIMHPHPVSVTQVPLRSWQSWGKPARQVSQGVSVNLWKRSAFCCWAFYLSIWMVRPRRQMLSPGFTRLDLSSDSIIPITLYRILNPVFHIFSNGVSFRVQAIIGIFYLNKNQLILYHHASSATPPTNTITLFY